MLLHISTIKLVEQVWLNLIIAQKKNHHKKRFPRKIYIFSQLYRVTHVTQMIFKISEGGGGFESTHLF